MSKDWIIPDWPVPGNVHSVITTRQGGISENEYSSMNCGDHVGDKLQHVTANRKLLAQKLSLSDSGLNWLTQVHGTRVLTINDRSLEKKLGVSEADASFTRLQNAACIVMTADCLPVLFCNRKGTAVAAAHAGWRGLADGVLESTLACFGEEDEVVAYLGPAISQLHFEVGQDVFDAFTRINPEHESAFEKASVSGKYFADIYLLARQKLHRAGVQGVYGGDRCTYEEAESFFSFRRESVTGRMASAIVLAPSA